MFLHVISYSSRCLYHTVQDLNSLEPHSILLLFRQHFVGMARYSNKKEEVKVCTLKRVLVQHKVIHVANLYAIVTEYVFHFTLMTSYSFVKLTCNIFLK